MALFDRPEIIDVPPKGHYHKPNPHTQMKHTPKKLLDALAEDDCLSVWIEPPHKWKEAQPDWDFRNGANNREALSRWCPEPSFGKQPCPCCEQHLAGDRYSVSIKGQGLWGGECRWDDDADICPDCHAFLASEGIVPTVSEVHLTVYEVSRNFGGHEEGGWWYDWYGLPQPAYAEDPAVPVALTVKVPVSEWEARREQVEATLKEAARQVGYIFAGDTVDTGHGPRKARSTSSVRPEVNATVTWETSHGKHASKERPHYC